MNKQELIRHVGSLQQVAYVRPVAYAEGRSSGLKAYDVKNGKLSMRIMADKCLDVSEFSYGGVNINFLSKPGLQGRNQYDTNGQEAIHSIMGGLFFTSGMDNICAPCKIDGIDYPMHGRARTTPAEHLSADAWWEGDDYLLKVSGEIREAALFGSNLVLRRSIVTKLGEKSVTVTDEIENQSFRDEPLMLLYHINMGYPFLDENTKLLIPTSKVTARDQDSEGHESEYDRMEAPKDNEAEYVFIHSLNYDKNGDTAVCVLNEPLGIGLKLEFNGKNLPYFMEWKSIGSGDYVVGLEPANSSVYGRPYHVKNGDLHRLAPFGKEKNTLRFTVLDGLCEIREEEKAFARKFPGLQ